MKNFNQKFGIVGWVLLFAIVAMGAKIGGDIVRFGTLTGNDIVLQLGEGQLIWDSGTSKMGFSNDSGSSVENIGADDQAGNTSNLLENVGVDSSVATSALTIKLVQKDGSTDATVPSEVRVAFRNSTLINGGFELRTVSTALSLVVPNTATLGHILAVDESIFVYLLDNAGAIELAISHSENFSESDLHTTTILDTSSDSGTTIYSTVARTDVPIRLIGRLVSNQTVAGVWDAAPTAEAVLTATTKDDTVISTGTNSSIVGSGLQSNFQYARINYSGGTPVQADGLGEWIDSVTDLGVGEARLNFKAGTFSGNPQCTCLARDNAHDKSCGMSDATCNTTSCILFLNVSNTGSGSDDGQVFIHCAAVR